MLTNRSSGKMGYALAKAAHRRGAEVVLISGPTNLKAIPHVQIVPVTTSFDMKKAVLINYKSCSIVIKAAAVADYRPKKASRKR